MDANGQRFWMLADSRHWLAHERTAWDPECRALSLASERSLPAAGDLGLAAATANGALEVVPRAVDALGAVAAWDGATGTVVARSHLPGEAITLRLATAPTDVAVGHDGVLYALLPSGVRLHDLRGRWSDVTVGLPGFTAWRCAAARGGGLWLLERGSGRLARLTGSPEPLGPVTEYGPDVFRPDPENCHAPAIRLLPEPAWDSGERPLALACQPDGELLLLSWQRANNGRARVRRLDPRTERLGAPIELVGARYAYALAWIDTDQIAVRLPGRPDAPAYRWDPGQTQGGLRPTGDVYPLASDALEAPFAHRLEGPPHYPVEHTGGARGTEPLHRLSLANLAHRGEARHYDSAGRVHLLDSGRPDTVWHRLYAEAHLPPRAGFTVWVAATPDPEPPATDRVDAWHPHHFGDVPVVGDPLAARASWEQAPSELPHHPGLACWQRVPHRSGLFSVLIQTPRSRVRAVSGRYLWLRLELSGDGRIGPRIAAVRAWGSRFSYRDQYLPRLYRESVFGAAAKEPGERTGRLPVRQADLLDTGGLVSTELHASLERAGLTLGANAEVRVEQAGESWQLRDDGHALWRLQRAANGIGIYRPTATPADFLDRLLANTEGILTPIEDRIAAAHLLSDPATAPEPSLEWLGAWLGVAFDPILPEARRRVWLQGAAPLARWHGTRRGLELALDLATDGGVRSGEIVVLEHYRLRRLFATLLGVDLAADPDPLLPGLVHSGNSVVGDTLVIGEAERAELLALFREDVATAAEQAAVLQFFEQLAYRTTVLVHQSVTTQDLGLLRRIVELEAPAHVEVRVLTATWPLLVGVASLVGVDTYLGPPEIPHAVELDRSDLGGGDFLLGTACVDHRVAGAATPAPPPRPPIAEAGPPREVSMGDAVTLDGSGSRAPQGRRITRYIWRRID